MNSNSDMHNEPNIEDPRFRITPVQQMAAACTGALITSTFGLLYLSTNFETIHLVNNKNLKYFSYSIGCHKSTLASSNQNNGQT